MYFGGLSFICCHRRCRASVVHSPSSHLLEWKRDETHEVAGKAFTTGSSMGSRSPRLISTATAPGRTSHAERSLDQRRSLRLPSQQRHHSSMRAGEQTCFVPQDAARDQYVR
jgi:hypothetical protein